MPTPDASSFTQFKRLKALEARTDTQKTITHLYQPQVTTSGLTNFLPSFTNKFTTGTRYIPIGFPITNPAPPPPAPVPIEVDFAGAAYSSGPVLFDSTTSVTLQFINVEPDGSYNTIKFEIAGYDFTGSSLNIISPDGYSFGFYASGDGYIEFISTSFSGISEWTVTLTVPTPISQIDAIIFEDIA